MDKSRRREFFWLFLIAGCVALFVARNERKAEAATYDQRGMTELVRETQNEPVAPRRKVQSDDELETASIATPVRRPSVSHAVAGSGFYVPLGSYGSIEQATRRYLDVAQNDPSLERDNKLRIETVNVKGDAPFHKVRLGNFETEKAAKNACVRAGISSSLCLVVAAR